MPDHPNSHPALLGAEIAPLAAETVNRVLDWLFSQEASPPEEFNMANGTAVLQCADSLVWGHSRDGSWQWANDADPAVRKPERVTLLEARLFTSERELLLWRAGDFAGETFVGRALADAPTLPSDAQHHPIDRCYSYDDDPGETLPGGFVRRVAEGGNVLIAPQGGGLKVRQYLEECETTGALRIAASRFVAIVETCGKKEGA
jgi:hypothetical protein